MPVLVIRGLVKGVCGVLIGGGHGGGSGGRRQEVRSQGAWRRLSHGGGRRKDRCKAIATAHAGPLILRIHHGPRVAHHGPRDVHVEEKILIRRVKIKRMAPDIALGIERGRGAFRGRIHCLQNCSLSVRNWLFPVKNLPKGGASTGAPAKPRLFLAGDFKAESPPSSSASTARPWTQQRKPQSLNPIC